MSADDIGRELLSYFNIYLIPQLEMKYGINKVWLQGYDITIYVSQSCYQFHISIKDSTEEFYYQVRIDVCTEESEETIDIRTNRISELVPMIFRHINSYIWEV